ncbi:MAG: ORF6N domain-containing protein [Bacteroidota bacterium]
MELVIIQKKIFEMRGQRVMLDFHLAEMYGVETKQLKRQVRRNIERFPEDFMFELTVGEWKILRSQFGTSSWGGIRILPFAFTEHGITMLSSVLRSKVAVDVNIGIIRAFILLKQHNNDFKWLRKEMKEMEARFNRKFENINEIIEYLTAKPPIEKPKPRKRIGFKIGGK